MALESFEEVNDGVSYAIAGGASAVLILALALYSYQYHGNSRWSRLRRWTSNLCGKCPLMNCDCCSTQSDSSRQGSHLNSLPSVSSAVERNDIGSISLAANLMGIADYKRSSLNINRNNLHFTNQLGNGWFGPVLLGTLQNLGNSFEPTYGYEEIRVPITDTRDKSDVVVIQHLREESKVLEKKTFLEEGKPFASVGSMNAAERHPNVLSMVGFCIEKPPILLVYEFCNHGDLKTFLIQNRELWHQFEKDNLFLRFCRDVTTGLSFLHKIHSIPTDLAARTCQVDHFYNIKIGDYGLARQMYPGDYLSCDLSTTIGFTSPELSIGHKSNFMPLRWMAPEVLSRLHQSRRSPISGGHSENEIKPSPAESIWSLGITLWEICSMGEIPFSHIGDHQFLLTMTSGAFNSSISTGTEKGQLPGHILAKGESHEVLFDVIDLCLKVDGSERTNCQRIENYLRDLYQCQVQDAESIPEEDLLALD